jgi:predicted aconitase
LQTLGGQPVAYIRGVAGASLEELKSFCASLATYGGAALFHMQGITPEAVGYRPPKATITIQPGELGAAARSLNDASLAEVDFVSLGCPHLSIREIARLAELLAGKRVTREFWITTAARPSRCRPDGTRLQSRPAGEIRCGYLLRGGADPGAFPGAGYGQRQGMFYVRQKQV